MKSGWKRPVSPGPNSKWWKKRKNHRKIWKVGVFCRQKNILLKSAIRNDEQSRLDKLIDYYKTGDLKTFDEYSILQRYHLAVDVVNGFIEVHDDRREKGSFESVYQRFSQKNFTIVPPSSKITLMEEHKENDRHFRQGHQCCGWIGRCFNSTAIGINLPTPIDWPTRIKSAAWQY